MDIMYYKVYDSQGKLVRAGFPNYVQALNYKAIFGNPGWYIKSK